MNLLSETEQKLKELGLTLDDIQFVMCTESEYGSDFIFMNKDTFVKNAQFVNYDNGYGSQEIIILKRLSLLTKAYSRRFISLLEMARLVQLINVVVCYVKFRTLTKSNIATEQLKCTTVLSGYF